ncbi:MAG TPA: hypothetical protein VER08_08160 [Pyrinomonadaceae bacterium]|nr:hypothetical protein [Pyrinomonadaceae bacterium]
MRSVAQVLLLLLVGASVCAAQGGGAKPRPDLSGKWLAEVSRDGGGRPPTALTLVVRHAEPELRITRGRKVDGVEATRESVYYTDGRGEKNTGPGLTERPDANPPPEQVFESRTAWKGDKLVTRARSRRLVAGRVVEVETTEEWKLSADGRTLTHSVTAKLSADEGGAAMPGHVPQGRATFTTSRPQVLKTVYRRAPE